MTAGPDEVRMEVVGVFEQAVRLPDREERVPLLLLRDPRNRELRLPISSCEGLAIHVALQQQVVARPLTHDLALRLLDRLSSGLSRVVIYEVAGEEGACRARLHLVTGEGELLVEAQPGDAVALAVRAEAPVYVTEELLAHAGQFGGDTV